MFLFIKFISLNLKFCGSNFVSTLNYYHLKAFQILINQIETKEFTFDTNLSGLIH